MAKHRASDDDQLTRQGAIAAPGAAYWSVDDGRWRTLRPVLPADVAELLAPPIVVGAPGAGPCRGHAASVRGDRPGRRAPWRADPVPAPCRAAPAAPEPAAQRRAGASPPATRRAVPAGATRSRAARRAPAAPDPRSALHLVGSAGHRRRRPGAGSVAA